MSKVTNDEFCTVDQISKKFNLTKSWLRYGIFHKLFPFYKLGRQIRIKESEFLDWINNKREGENS
ncbi:helix-turn-helix domain-containing protein [Bacteriovoracaceae bacterium]|nr:helix-turn-helix domain-containing protein [Bacteriovoracaceae bacterium]